MTTMERLAEAEREALGWPGYVLAYVSRSVPSCYQGLNSTAWVLTVALARREDETPQMAADRLHQYVTLYIERHGVSPSMLALRGSE